MSVKLLWKAFGSNHRMFVVQWRMQLSLSGLLPWMIGSTDHTQKHIGIFSFGFCWLRRSLLLSSQKSKSNLHSTWAGASHSTTFGPSPSDHLNQPTTTTSPHHHPIKYYQQDHHAFASAKEKETSPSTIKNNIIIAPRPPKKNQKKKSKEEEVTVKIRYLVKRKCIISGESE